MENFIKNFVMKYCLIVFKNHFDEIKKSLVHNKEIIVSMKAPESSTDGEKVLLEIIKNSN